MTRLRILLHGRRWLALLIVVAALAVRIVVPAGTMPGRGADGVTLVVCDGHAMAAMPGMTTAGDAGSGRAGGDHAGKTDAPCAFTGLVAAALDAPVLPVLSPLPPPPAVVAPPRGDAVPLRPVRLRPPSRGPPGSSAA